MMVVILLPPLSQLRHQNTLVKIGLIELIEPSGTLQYKPFFKHCILQTILHELYYCLYFLGIRFFVLKTELLFFIFWFGWGTICVTILNFLKFISYSICSLLGTAVKWIHKDTCTNTYFNTMQFIKQQKLIVYDMGYRL